MEVTEGANITRWRDEPVKPDGYDDVRALVGAARTARGRVVDFDWSFTADELRRLRQAVYEWGSGFAGRYRTFDLHVLEAINDALGEAETRFVLTRPTTAESTAETSVHGSAKRAFMQTEIRTSPSTLTGTRPR